MGNQKEGREKGKRGEKGKGKGKRIRKAKGNFPFLFLCPFSDPSLLRLFPSPIPPFSVSSPFLFLKFISLKNKQKIDNNNKYKECPLKFVSKNYRWQNFQFIYMILKNFSGGEGCSPPCTPPPPYQYVTYQSP